MHQPRGARGGERSRRQYFYIHQDYCIQQAWRKFQFDLDRRDFRQLDSAGNQRYINGVAQVFETYGAGWSQLCAELPPLRLLFPLPREAPRARARAKESQPSPSRAARGRGSKKRPAQPTLRLSPKPSLRQSRSNPLGLLRRRLATRPAHLQSRRPLHLEVEGLDLELLLLVACRWQRPRLKGRRHRAEKRCTDRA